VHKPYTNFIIISAGVFIISEKMVKIIEKERNILTLLRTNLSAEGTFLTGSASNRWSPHWKIIGLWGK
jgi:hypothetical protein